MARILLTGGSSFTGLWIAEALAAAGHEVTAAVTRLPQDYSGLRAERIERLGRSATIVFEAGLTSARFGELIASGFDLFAHHGADIPNYRSADYDVVEGVRRNIAGVETAIEAHAKAGGHAVIATGTAFEAGEGRSGPGEDLAVSPYGLSKSLTNETIRHFARWRGLSFGRFVIAGPFGPMEEGRLGWSLFQRWFKGEAGIVRTPRYVRDNIPVDLLAQAYVRLAGRVLEAPADMVARPSGFVGAQEDFARQLSAEMAPRLGLPCEVACLAQPEFAEPLVRVNSEPCLTSDWPAAAFWDSYADYYRRLAHQGRLDTPA